MAFLGGNRAAGRTRNPRTNRGTGAAAHASANDITQRTTQATTKGGCTVTGDCTLSNQKTQNQSRQCETHDENLKK
ncbi:hypothetical protein D3C76_1346560 [compost metagenome]